MRREELHRLVIHVIEDASDRGWNLSREDVAVLAASGWTTGALLEVSCGGGRRFLAMARDVQYFIDIIERDATGWVSAIIVPPGTIPVLQKAAATLGGR
jgi:hypothetical protein